MDGQGKLDDDEIRDFLMSGFQSRLCNHFKQTPKCLRPEAIIQLEATHTAIDFTRADELHTTKGRFSPNMDNSHRSAKR
jgi:hypothetical protein